MFLYPFLQGERRLQGPIWSSKGKTVPADAKRGRSSHLETISRTTVWKKKIKKKKKNRKMEAAAERRQSASTDGCLLSSNYTDEGSFSHLRLRLSADEDVRVGFTSLIDKWTGLNKQRHAVTQVSRLLDKNLPADVLFLHTDTVKKTTKWAFGIFQHFTIETDFVWRFSSYLK